MNLSSCRSVCLALGPYRNLTTLTASVLFLHPQCQVLNHAGKRIFCTESDFLEEYTAHRVDNFIRHAIELSATGERGAYGGSITLSHAFDGQHRMKELFEQARLPIVKQDIRAVFWKESHRTANLIRERGVDLSALFATDPRPRFLLPIRYPLDCAVSNIKSGHVQFFNGLTDPKNLTAVCDAVLDEILWVIQLAAQFPGRFFHFYEHAIDDDMLLEMERFLELDHHQGWLSLARDAMVNEVRYVHPPALVEHYRAAVAVRFGNFPEVAAQLLAFAH